MQTAAREQPRLRHLARWVILPRSRGPADIAKRRVQVALLVLLLLLAAILAAGILSAFSLYRSAENRYIHVVFPLQTAVRNLEVGMLQEENGVRGYMLTTNYQSLTPYFKGRGVVLDDLFRIAELTRNQPQA